MCTTHSSNCLRQRKDNPFSGFDPKEACLAG